MSPFLTAISSVFPPQLSATSLHATTLATELSSSAMISFKRETTFPASTPFLILIDSGPSTSMTATSSDTFLDARRGRDSLGWSDARVESAVELNVKDGKRAMEESSEYASLRENDSVSVNPVSSKKVLVWCWDAEGCEMEVASPPPARVRSRCSCVGAQVMGVASDGLQFVNCDIQTERPSAHHRRRSFRAKRDHNPPQMNH
jgi:hypothetical protein